jgi:hypothetical protein
MRGLALGYIDQPFAPSAWIQRSSPRRGISPLRETIATLKERARRGYRLALIGGTRSIHAVMQPLTQLHELAGVYGYCGGKDARTGDHLEAGGSTRPPRSLRPAIGRQTSGTTGRFRRCSRLLSAQWAFRSRRLIIQGALVALAPALMHEVTHYSTTGERNQ